MGWYGLFIVAIVGVNGFIIINAQNHDNNN